MTNPVSKAVTLYRNRGALGLLKRSPGFAYETIIRSRLPRRTATYNDVTVQSARLFDSYFPWETVDRPAYESGLIDGLETTVETGDEIVIVGGGWGVSTVVAASLTGRNGSVHTFEAAAEAVDRVRKTISLNDVTADVAITQAIVAEEISTRGDASEAPLLAPSDLPVCDVLVLDCEGAERSILSTMAIKPRVVIVETHGHLDAPSLVVHNLLAEQGYTIIDKQIADESKRSFCDMNDIKVLVAVRS